MVANGAGDWRMRNYNSNNDELTDGVVASNHDVISMTTKGQL